MRYVGSEGARYLQARYADILARSCAEVVKQCPDVEYVQIGNACLAGFLRGEYPKGNDAHRTGAEFDFNYITYSGGATQYGDPAKIPFQRIWLSDDPKNMVLDEKTVHWKANYIFITELHRQCTGRRGEAEWQFIIHEKIADLILRNLSHKQRIEFNGIISLDAGRHLNHDGHGHVKLDNQLYEG